MTGLMHEREFSRKSFLKGGGALIVGFSIAGAGFAGKAQADAVSPFTSNGPAPGNQIDSWLTVHADNTASLRSGRIELGQGSSTGLLQIVGEELDMAMSQLKHVPVDTGGPNMSPYNGNTGNSSSINQGAPPVRAAAAAARQALLSLASVNLGVPVASLAVASGVVSGGGKTITYGALINGGLFNVTAAPSYNLTQALGTGGFGSTIPAIAAGLGAGVPNTKPVSSYTLVGTSPPRIDIPDKVTGTYTYIQNVRVPGMLHGRVVRPRGQSAYDGKGANLLSIDESSISHIPNVQIVRKGNFLGVVAPQEWDAIQAAAQLKVTWADPSIPLPGDGNLFGTMRAAGNAGQTIDTRVTNTGNVGNAFASAAKVVSATFTAQHNYHGPIGPHAAVADVTPAGALIMAHVKDAYNGTRAEVAAVLGLPVNLVRVKYYEGASAFGSGAIHVDAADAAAVMSQAVGKPVRVQFMRSDDHGWDNYGTTQLIDVRGGIDSNGKIVAWDFTAYLTKEIGKMTVQTTGQLVGTPWPSDFAGSGERTADANNGGGQYAIPNFRVTGKVVPAFGGILKGSSMRGASQGETEFATEQLIDELAYSANMDPLAFRLQNMTDSRWIGPLQAAAAAANWQPRVANSVKQTGETVSGRGIGLGTHSSGNAAAVAEIEVNTKTGKITVQHIYAAQDSGLTINPGLVENQMSGALVQATGRMLNEEVKFTKSRVTSLDWVTYPIGRFKDHPNVTTSVVQRTDLQPQGAGEPAAATPGAAIANAFFDATGVRIRQLPMTAAAVRATLKAAGVA
jgi:nicotinate dehydrogenase subunit B